MIEDSDAFDEDLNVDGKLALFLKGKVKGKYLVTASYDSERRPSETAGVVARSKLFTNLDPDAYYPVYGDGSSINFEASDTQDEYFLLVEWDESFAKWGSFHTDIPLYNRTLHGGSIHYESVDKTKFGEAKHELQGFVARSFQDSKHDELLATGGSLYYTSERDIIEGSEKIKVEVKDRVTKTVLQTFHLEEEKDYEIDYESGRILLSEPLSSTSFSYQSSILSNDVERGSIVFLVVDYEFKTLNAFRRSAYGVKGSTHLGDHIKVGGTYIEEEKFQKDYTLEGGEVGFRLNEHTDLSVEVHESTSVQNVNTTSIDGGLSNTIDNDSLDERTSEGDLIRIQGKTKLFDKTSLDASFTDQEEGFSSTGNAALSGSRIYQGSLLHPLEEDLTLGLSHITQESEAGEREVNRGDHRIHTTTASVNKAWEKIDLRVEHQHQAIERPLPNFVFKGTRELEEHDLSGVRVGYRFDKGNQVFGGGQVSYQGRDNNQVFFGGQFRVFEDTSLVFREVIGNSGDHTSLNLIRVRDPHTQESMGITKNQDGSLNWNQGLAMRVNDKSKMYVKHDYSPPRKVLDTVTLNQRKRDSLKEPKVRLRAF